MLNIIKNIKLSSIVFSSLFFGLLINQAFASKILQQEESYRIYQILKQDFDSDFLKESMVNLAQEIAPKKNVSSYNDLVSKQIRSIDPDNDIFIIAQNKQLKFIGWMIFKKTSNNTYLITSKAGINIQNFDLGKNLLLSITKISNTAEKFKIIAEYPSQEKAFFESLGFKQDFEYSKDTNRASLILFNQKIIQNNLPMVKELNKILSSKLNEIFNYQKNSYEPSTYKFKEKLDQRFFIQEIAPYIPEIEELRNKILEIKKYYSLKVLPEELNILEIHMNECSELINKLTQIIFAKTSPIRIIQ